MRMAIRLRWGVRRRLESIDFRLFWDGRFNRSDMADTFGISAQQASADISQYDKFAPGNLPMTGPRRPTGERRAFLPAFIGETIERYLLQFVAIENRWMRQEDTWFDAIPPVEVVTSAALHRSDRACCGCSDAIRNRLEIDIEYSSLTGSVQHFSDHRPHALSHSAGRWYSVPGHASTTTFGTTTLTESDAVNGRRPASVDPALDFEWVHIINLVDRCRTQVLSGAPSRDRRRARDDRWPSRSPCRLSLSFYLMSEYNLDVEPGMLKPEKQQIVLQNRDEVIQARALSRKMSIEALARTSVSWAYDMIRGARQRLPLPLEGCRQSWS